MSLMKWRRAWPTPENRANEPQTQRGARSLSSAIPVPVDCWETIGKEEGQSFSDLYLATERLYLDDDEAIGSRSNCDV